MFDHSDLLSEALLSLKGRKQDLKWIKKFKYNVRITLFEALSTNLYESFLLKCTNFSNI